MAIPWPVTIPQYMELGEDETLPKLALRSNLDSGRPKLRLRSIAGARVIGGTVQMTVAQVEIFDLFYIIDLKNGMKKFTWKHPRTGVTTDFYFASVPKYRSETDKKNIYLVSLELEIMP